MRRAAFVALALLIVWVSSWVLYILPAGDWRGFPVYVTSVFLFFVAAYLAINE